MAKVKMKKFSKAQIQKLLRTSIITIVWIISIVCLVVYGYLIVYRRVDQSLCYNRVGKTVGIDPDYASIRSHIQSNILPGMTRQEVISTLEKLGPVDHIGDTVRINMCSHPLNDITLHFRYSWGKLESFKFDDS